MIVQGHFADCLSPLVVLVFFLGEMKNEQLTVGD